MVQPPMAICSKVRSLLTFCASYFFLIRFEGTSKGYNFLVNLLSRPGMWVQNMTTKEPDDSMIEVGIRAVEEVFDWRTWQKENL